jgi:membrane protein implicated in regulation of membrane protease activity
MIPGYLWLTAGIVVGCAELLHPGFFLMWLGTAAALTGLLLLVWPLPLEWQLGAFVLLALLLVGLAAARRARLPARGDPVNGPGVDIVGKSCRAEAFSGAEGRVRFRDSTWQAETTDTNPPAPGASLCIVGVRGATLLVSAQPASGG